METANLYTSELHLFKIKEKNIALDVKTSRVFSIDSLAYDILDQANENTGDHLCSVLAPRYSRDEILGTLDELKQARLVQESPFEAPAPTVEVNGDLPLLAMDFILAQDCNLRCRYCFADTGAFRGERSLMTAEVAKKAVDYMILRSGKHKHLNITFFGGEPTVNIPVLKETIEYCEAQGPLAEKEFHFSISTNGTLLTEEFSRYLHNKKVNVQISIDGDEKTQNRNRPYQGNTGTYDDVKENTEQYLRVTGHSIHARTTVTTWDIEDFIHNVNHLLSLGFSSVHMEPASGVKGKIFLNSENDIRKLIEQFEQMAEFMLDKITKSEYIGYENFINNLRLVHKNMRKLWFCGAGRGYLSVGGDGKVYPCHRFVGNNKFIVGDVFTQTYDPTWEKFITTENAVVTRPSCSSCWARFLCGGDCPAHNEEKYGDIRVSDPLRCSLIQRLAELTLMIYAQIPKGQKSEIARIYNFDRTKVRQPEKQEQG